MLSFNRFVDFSKIMSKRRVHYLEVVNLCLKLANIYSITNLVIAMYLENFKNDPCNCTLVLYSTSITDAKKHYETYAYVMHRTRVRKE